MSDTLSLQGLVFETVLVQASDNILTITLNRPESRNAINDIMANELVYALDYAAQQRSIRVVVLAATGKIFCAGGDLRGMSGQRQDAASSTVPKRGGADDISLRIRHLCKPVITKIQGSVYAGALLMVCNATHAIAVKEANFSAPEILRGIWPFMVMAGLFRVMPKRAGLDFIMRGQPINAERAAQLGLINEAVERDQLDLIVAQYAKDLASLAPGSMQMGLRAYNQQADMDFDDALPMLKQQIDACLQTADAKEGINAFLEKRQPNWD